VGTAGLTASVPVTAGATYAWSISGGGVITGGATTSTVTFTATATPSLTVTVTVTSTNTAHSTNSATVSVYAPPDTTITAPSQVTASATQLTASVPAQSGFTYSWTLGGGQITQGATTNSIQFTAASAPMTMTLTATLTNAVGLAKSSSVPIQVYAAPVTTITAPSSVTAGTTGLTASVPAQPGDSYSWTISGGTITAGQTGSAVTFTAGTGPTLTLSCTVTNQANTALTGSTTINVYPPPNSTVSVSASNVTAGASFTASVPAQAGSFVWTFGGTGTSPTITAGAGTNSITVSASLTAGSPGTLTITCAVQNPAGTTSTSTTVTVTVYAPPVAAVTTPAALTANTAGYTASVPAQTGAAYQWTITGGTITAGASTNAVIFTTGSPGTLSLAASVTNGAGAVATTSPAATGQIFAQPSCVITAPANATSNSMGLSASVPQTGSTYSWTISGGTITAGAATNAITFSAGSGTSLTLSCSATNPAGTNVTGNARVNVVPPPIASVTAPSSVMAGASFTASVPAQSGMTYSWSFAETNTAQPTITAGAGTYSLTLADALTSGTTGTLTISSTVTNAALMTASGAATVTVNAPPGPPVTPSANVVTAFSTGLTASVSPQASATYSWTISGGTITSGAAASSIIYSAGPVGTLTLSCVVTTPGVGSSLPGTATVQVVSVPATPAISGATTVTSGLGGWTASVPARSGMSYVWSMSPSSAATITSANGSGVFSSDGSQNSITYTANAAPSTSFTISCTEVNAAGATSSAGLLTVNVVSAPAAPVVTANAPVTSGVGGFTASVSARSGMMYSWSVTGAAVSSPGGSGGQFVSGLNQITFSVTAPAAGMVTIGCQEMNGAGTASAQYTVTLSVIAPPVQPVISAPAYVTTGASGIAAWVPARAGMTYWWTISGGTLTNTGGFSGNTSGAVNSITFTVTGPVGNGLTLTCVETNAAGTTSSAGQATAVIADAPVTPRIVAKGLVAVPNTTGLTATVTARTGMTYAWAIEPISTSAGATISGSSAGVTSGAVNTLTFASGAVGSIVLSCVETNAAGVSSLPGSSAPIVVGMPAIQDVAAVATSAPAQQGVGRLPGKPSVEGGAASYEIPIEIPPGRNGMQPQVALVYNSRNGNGIAGVGWALRATSSLTRCPRILDTDGFAKPVMFDGDDRLCLDGQRLVLANGSTAYGTNGSEYRTEVEQFDKVTLSGAMSDPTSTFEVWHKSGRRSQYATVRSFPSSRPQVWHLLREFDAQGNCMVYMYGNGPTRQYVGDSESVFLATILYSGYGNADTGNCGLDASARTVQFTYTDDRPDKRTTYLYGSATSLYFRLQSIATKVPSLSTAVPGRMGSDGTTVRVYKLAYAVSNATGRSLLHSVQLCAEATCSSDLALPPTVFTYRDDPPQFETKQPQMYYSSSSTDPVHWQPVGSNYRVTLGPDFDGDGTADPILTQLTPRMSYVYLSGTSSLVFMNIPDFDIRSDEVVYRDGKALLTTNVGGYLAFAPLANGTIDTANAIKTNFAISSNLAGMKMIDYNGDGVPDFDFVDPTVTNQLLQEGVALGSLSNFRDLSQWQPVGWNPPNPCSACLSPDKDTPQGWVRALTQDLNGDGTRDVYFEEAAVTTSDLQSFIQFLSRGTGGYSQPLYFFSSVGGPTGSPQTHPRRRWIDVNGDGLPDLYEGQVDPTTGIATLYLNMGGPPGTTIFKAVPVGGNTFDVLRARNALVMDVDGDGLPELIVPNSRVIPFCGGDYGHMLPNGEPAYFCGDAFDNAPISYRSYDRSVFAWDAYKFVEQPDGSYQLVLLPNSPGAPPRDPSLPPLPALNLQAPTNYPSTVIEDFSGDGLSDIGFSLLNFPDHQQYQDPTTPLGFYTSTNVAPNAPDLLVGAQDGLGAVSSWTHRPLVIGMMAQNARTLPNNGLGGCVLPSGQPFYFAPHDGSNSNGYSFFTSSMWVVSDFDASDGVGGMTRTCYRYQDAMVSDWGRGFQGFRFITAEQQFPLAAGEDGTNAPTGCGGKCSPNNQRAVSEFHQEFPLAGKLKRVTISLANGPGGTLPVLSDTLYWWHQLQSQTAVGSWIVYSSGTLETKQDLAGGMLAQTTGVVVIDPSSGEPTAKCSLSQNATPLQGAGPPQLASIALVETDTPYPNDTVNWVLGQLNQRTTQTGFWSGSSPLPACDTRVTGSNPASPGAAMQCGALPPTCTSVTLTAASTQTRSYTWKPKGINGYQKLESEKVQFNGALEARTTYTYDKFGNTTQVQVTGRDVCEAASCPTPTTDQSPTLISYESTGYFVSSKQDPKGLTSTFTFAPESGAPACTQEITSSTLGRSAQTCRSYDALGRLTEVTKKDGNGARVEPDLEVRVSSCSGNCALKAQTFQAGDPISTKYVDQLGRTIAEGAEGFDGLGLEVLAKRDYNSRGQKVAEYPPGSTGAGAGQWSGANVSPYPTSYVFDALGRVTSKTVLRDASLFINGLGDASITTTYAHSVSSLGLLTTISLPKAASVGGALSMTRTYDRGGRLVETTQDVTVPTARTIKAHYFYDPMGHVTAILDSNGNQITARYDDLGRKTDVTDPDRGAWHFEWDGLGRLRSETDANGNRSIFVYDFVGRKIKRYVNTVADPPAATWTYDGLSGLLTSVAGVDGYLRSSQYDPLLRPTRVTTDIPAGDSWGAREFVVQYAYDSNYGRLKEMAYPSGEFVKLVYDARGHLLGEAQVNLDGTAGTSYRTVTAMSPRGAVTAQTLGNGVHETMSYDDSVGIAKQVSATLGAPPTAAGCSSAPGAIRCTDYSYDQFLNLARQAKQFPQPGGVLATASEVYQYDELQRLLGESRSYVNLTPSSTTALSESYTYDDIGNIVSKSDFGGPYTYGDATRPSGAGPHAVLSVWDPAANANKAKYAYDPNGNMLCDFFAGYDASGNLLCGGRRVGFDDQDRPVQIKLNGVTTIFRYTPDGDRYLQRTTTFTGTSRTVYYVDKLYERVDWDQKTSEERTYIGPSVVVDGQDAGPNLRQVRYLHLDRLGSTDTVTDSTGGEMQAEAHGFDAFGGPRARDWQPSGNQLYPGGEFGITTARGFTGHEHLDETFLIHMNGRVYDYRLGRFLSVDPIISNPASSQSINPYSYIGNNPLSGVDPTGYECNDYSFAMCGTFIYHASDEKPQQFRIKVISETENGKTVFEGTVTPSTPVKDVLGPGATGQQHPADAANANTTSTQSRIPLGAMIASTVIDGRGHVLDAHDDGDVGVYQVGPSSTRRIGETRWPDSFLTDPDTAGVRRPAGQVFVGTDMPAEIVKLATDAMAMTSAEVAIKSLPGNSLDVKQSSPGLKPYDGFMLQGKYVTLRDMGDILAGFNARSHGFTLDEISRITGALQVAGPFGAAANYLTGGKVKFGPPPYYGETPYAGSRVVYGYNSNIAPIPPAYHQPVTDFDGFRGSPFLGLLGPRP
jgi:RHS repeat-associated protein